jgi:hypothetical protein
MGLESCNYVFYTKQDMVLSYLTKIISEIGYVQQYEPNIITLTLPNKFWIDLLLLPGEQSALSIRVALCNPPDVLVALRQLVEALFKHYTGLFLCINNRKTYKKMTSTAFNQIANNFYQNQKILFDHFGFLEAAISAEDVFSSYRKLR